MKSRWLPPALLAIFSSGWAGCSAPPGNDPALQREQVELLRQINARLEEMASRPASAAAPAGSVPAAAPRLESLAESPTAVLEDRLGETNRKLELVAALLQAQNAMLQRMVAADDAKYQQILQEGMKLQASGDHPAAIGEFTRAIDSRPELFNAYLLRGASYLEQEQWKNALADFQAGGQLNPESSDAWNNIAWILATCPDDKLRDGDQAVKLANLACELTEWKDFTRLSTLAAAYAEVGDFDSAVQWQQKCLELMPADQRQALMPALELYRQKMPNRMEKRPQPD